MSREKKHKSIFNGRTTIEKNVSMQIGRVRNINANKKDVLTNPSSR